MISLNTQNSQEHQPPLLSQVSAVDHAASPYFVAYPHPYRFIVDEPDRCQQESPFLVLMVPVSLHNREARDVIRSAWGKETTVMGRVVSHYFVLGQPREGDPTELIQEQVSALIFFPQILVHLFDFIPTIKKIIRNL